MSLRRVVVGALLLCVSIAAPSSVFAAVTLPRLFSDNMVIQRDQPVPVWGWAEAGETITVTFADQTKTGTAAADGRWMLRLDTLRTSAEGRAMTVRSSAGGKETTIANVLVGDVWLASGQSNMNMLVRDSTGGADIVARAEYDGIRLFEVTRDVAVTPQKDVAGGQWYKANDKPRVGAFSAIGYCFAERVHKELNVPVGVVLCAVGATMAEHWVSEPVLRSDADFQWIFEWWQNYAAKWPYGDMYPDIANHVQAYHRKAYEEMRRVNIREAQLKKTGEKLTQAELDAYAKQVDVWKVYKRYPAGLYNAMLHPVIPFGIRGMLWYQGESNDDRPKVYAKLLPALVQSWRKEWHEAAPGSDPISADIPFLVVSLAAFHDSLPEPSDSNWARIREVHWNIQKQLPNVWTALAIDLGEAKQIHPPRKEEVAHRLALLALRHLYGKDVVCSGPVFDSMKVEGELVRLKFAHADGGLVTTDNQPVKGFALAAATEGGAAAKWTWAEGTIEGDSVILKARGVTQPVAVRYAWANNPVCNLYNKAGLPAAPFRTDDW